MRPRARVRARVGGGEVWGHLPMHCPARSRTRSFRRVTRARTFHAALDAGVGDDAVADRGVLIAKKNKRFVYQSQGIDPAPLASGKLSALLGAWSKACLNSSPPIPVKPIRVHPDRGSAGGRRYRRCRERPLGCGRGDYGPHHPAARSGRYGTLGSIQRGDDRQEHELK